MQPLSLARFIYTPLLLALFSGCGSITHHLGPDSPVDRWEKANELTDSVEARLTLASGHQLLVSDIDLKPDTSSFIGTDSHTRLLICTDQIDGALLFKRGRNAFRNTGLGILIGGGCGALLGYGEGDHDRRGEKTGLSAGEKTALGGLVGGIIGGVVGFTNSMGRESIALHYNVERDNKLFAPGKSPPRDGTNPHTKSMERTRYGNTTYWRYSSAIGYAAAMSGAAMGGWYLSDEETGFEVAPIGLAGGCLGLYYGYKIGAGADNALLLGEPLPGSRRYAVRLGTILAGAGAGLLAASAEINSSDNNWLGGPSDEQVIRDKMLIGTGLGLLAQLYFDSRLYPGSRTEAALVIDPAGPSLAFRFAFD